MNTEEILREKWKLKKKETVNWKNTITEINFHHWAQQQIGDGKGRINKTEVGLIKITQTKGERKAEV